MKTYFLILIITFLSLGSNAQVDKNNLQVGLGLIFLEYKLNPITGSLGLEYQRNFKREGYSFWTYQLGVGALYSTEDRLSQALPYVQTGIEKSISLDGTNFLHLGVSLLNIFPEVHIGYTFIPQKSSSGIFKVYLSNLFLEGEHLLGLGFGYSFSS